MSTSFLHAASAQDTDSASLCQRSRLNPHCKVYQVSQQPIDAIQEAAKPKVVKLKLNDLSGVSEWIRAEITGNQVKLLYTVVTQSGLSKAITSVAKLPIAIDHTWYDHPTTRTAFRPDDCNSIDCLVAGTDLITVPTGTDLYQGQFTLEYTESGWMRTIMFRLPR